MHTVKSNSYTFTERNRERILEATRKGLYKAHAAKAAGMSYQTLWRWLKYGEEDRQEWEELADEEKDVTPLSPFHAFLLDFEEAEVNPMEIAVESWVEKLPESWQACVAFLERRYPEQWARKFITEKGSEQTQEEKIQLEW